MLKLKNIPRPTDRLQTEIEATQLHDHLCLIYSDKAEGLYSASIFIKSGLTQQDKCVYVIDDHTTAAAKRALRQQDIAVEQALQEQRLTLTDKRGSYLPDGVFNPDQAIQFFAAAADEARQQGYRGIRGAAEMTWQLGGDPGCERLLEYESRMNQELFPHHPAVGLCLFSLQRFSAEVIREVLFTHPKVIIGGLVCKNFYYKPPEYYTPQDSMEDAEHEVMRMLTNIYEFEQNEVELQQSHSRLEQKVLERTAELEAKAAQLKSMNAHLVGREYRIRELEAENQQLKLRLDQLISQAANGLERQLSSNDSTVL